MNNKQVQITGYTSDLTKAVKSYGSKIARFPDQVKTWDCSVSDTGPLKVRQSESNRRTEVRGCTRHLYRCYINMLCALYRDIASAYPAQYEFEHKKDLEYLIPRSDYEGISFLTVTLPAIAKAIDKALATGSPLNVPHFQRKKGTCLPICLGWLLEKVFDTRGFEREDADPLALVHLRQLLYLFYKLETPYTEAQRNRVIDDFVSVESGLNTPIFIREPVDKSVLKKAKYICHLVLGGLATDNLIPKHGPGSVATGEKTPEKAYFKRYYRHLHEIYPYDEYMYMNAGHQSERLSSSGLACYDPKTSELSPPEELDYSTAKVVLVPKDSRGPRLISMEPLEIQWIQQGQCVRLVSRLESHWITRGHVNFSSQDINRYLAHYASMFNCEKPKTWGPHAVEVIEPPSFARPTSQDLVTIDMKEASDRVSLALVYNLFPSNWIKALDATRSDFTKLPSGQLQQMSKFAPMGSAVCFPVESFCFFALAVASVMQERSLSLPNARKRVWVYGDDIVCHREDYPVIKRTLELVGLMLNEQKSCTQGFFRESCGVDAYKGIIVTPLRIKKCVTRRFDGQTIMAYVAYSNAAYRCGYTELAQEIEILLQPHCTIPYTTEERGMAQFVRPTANVQKLNKRSRIRTRFNKHLHILEAFGFVPRALISKGHRVTYETYFSKFVSKYSQPEGGPPPAPHGQLPKQEVVPRDAGLLPDQYSVPRRVSSRLGWTQITL